MPRIYDRYRNPLDFCGKCYPAQENKYADGISELDAEHPPYEDAEDYKCDSCKKLLTEKDNWK